MRDVILVIEDEPGIVDFLGRGLEAHGFAVDSALDGITGLERALSSNVDLVVLDMMLPGRSGLDVLAALRTTRPTLPVIMLTARSAVDDRITALESGAADYMTKPFSVEELAARIRAKLRMADQAPTTTLRAGHIEIDLLSRQVLGGGERVRLSATEFDLLAFLVRNRGRVLSREQILHAVWGYRHDPGTNIVDVYIGYLRRKLGKGAQNDPITTIRSVGYRLDAHG